jgi:hypothetical protein
MNRALAFLRWCSFASAVERGPFVFVPGATVSSGRFWALLQSPP